jgi:dihydrolipoamide dehydrogenase
VPVEDEAVSAELARTFRKQGITSLTGTKVTSATVKGNKVVAEAQLPDGKTQTLEADYLLVATGRGPVIEGPWRGAGRPGDSERLRQGGRVLSDQRRGYLRRWATSSPSAKARGIPQLAHVSSAEGILVAERLAGQEVRPINYDHVPGCTYCDPEIGSVGLTEQAAKDGGYDVRTGSFPFRALGRARMADETDGFVKIVADKKYDEILGVHIIGPRATELIAEAVLALRTECTVEELIRTIHAHPTMSEAVGEAAHATHGAAIHI